MKLIICILTKINVTQCLELARPKQLLLNLDDNDFVRYYSIIGESL